MHSPFLNLSFSKPLASHGPAFQLGTSQRLAPAHLGDMRALETKPDPLLPTGALASNTLTPAQLVYQSAAATVLSSKLMPHWQSSILLGQGYRQAYGEEGLLRWAYDCLPIGVRWHRSRFDWLNEAMSTLLPRTLQQWENAAAGKLSFQAPVCIKNTGIENIDIESATPCLYNAGSTSTPFLPGHIVIGWRQSPLAHHPQAVGQADRQLNAQGQVMAATIVLLEAPAVDQTLSQPQRLLRLQATVLHELGHALGLEHSNQPQDVMHAQGWRNPVLSAQDVLQLQRRYGPSPHSQRLG
ncbi:MAG: matrixin family metalloprotease [Candidatus Melainabacteria bacterium]|nr:matrixin family metalloprotease [Candidatus Melainabacteria bacterium]